MTAREIDAAVVALALEIRAALAQAEAASTLSSLDTSTLGAITAVLSLSRQTLTTLQTELGADFGAQTSPSDAPRVLAAWTWQRDLALKLLRLDVCCRLALEHLGRLTPNKLRQITARQGDTLQALAAKHLGDFRRWPEIASLNALAPGSSPVGQLWVPNR